MQPVNANGVPVAITTQPVFYVENKQLRYTNMRKDLSKQLIILGSLQLLVGVLCVILEAVSLGLTQSYDLFSLAFVGYGFWIGIMFIITGPFGINGGRQRSRCSVIAFSVLSIISASFAAVLLSLAIPSALIYRPWYYYYYDSRSSKYSYRKDALNGGIAMESLMAFAAVFEAIVAIWSAVVCCKVGACCCDCGGDCCCPPSSATTQIMMTTQPFAGQPVNVQQPYIVSNGYNQQQPVVMADQPPMYYPMVSGQQPVVNPDDQLHKGF